jgi:hypothetical protein
MGAQKLWNDAPMLVWMTPIRTNFPLSDSSVRGVRLQGQVCWEQRGVGLGRGSLILLYLT